MNNYSSIISGHALQMLFTDTYKQRLKSFGLFDNPTATVQAIEQCFGAHPSISGHNILGIKYIRDEIFRIGNVQLANALSIVAPHTHWSSCKPVVYTKNKNTYYVGPFKVDLKSKYAPVSYLLTCGQALPYEWADIESISFDLLEFEKVIRSINEINDALGSKKWPLGISINFRYKQLFEKPSVVTIENPCTGNMPLYEEASFIEIMKEEASNNTVSTEQVSWHAYSDLLYRLSEKEAAILKKFRDKLSYEDVNYNGALSECLTP